MEISLENLYVDTGAYWVNAYEKTDDDDDVHKCEEGNDEK